MKIPYMILKLEFVIYIECSLISLREKIRFHLFTCVNTC